MAKYKLRFFFEYGHGCLWTVGEESWNTFGNPANLEKLHLSESLRNKLQQLEEKFQTSLNWDYPPDPSPWRQDVCDAFNAEVVETFDEIVKELGAEFEVVNEQESLNEDPDLNEYLKNQKEFKRKES